MSMTAKQRRIYKAHLNTIRNARGPGGSTNPKPWGEGVDYKHSVSVFDRKKESLAFLAERYKPVARDDNGRRI